MTKSAFLSASIFAICLLSVVRAGGQETAAPKASQTPPAPSSLEASYRLTYALTELEDGKKIDSRTYSLQLASGSVSGRPSVGRLQIGTRIPAGTKADGTTQSLDVGTTLTANLSQHDGGVFVDTTCDITSVVADEVKVDNRPILHTLTIMNNMPVAEGKPMLVGTADDPNSKREFQLEVTVAQLK